MDQDDDRFGFPDRDGGDAVKPLGTTLRRAAAADQPVQGHAGLPAPLLRADAAPPPPAPLPAVAPMPVRAYLLAAIRAGVHEVLRGAPAALGFAVAYRDVAGDGDLGLAAWARSGILVPALHVASAAAVRAAGVIAGHLLAAAHGLQPSHAAVRAFLREAPAAFAVAAAYRGLAAWGLCTLVYSVLHVAGTAAVRAAAVIAGHPLALAAALGLRPRHAVRDIVIVVLAVAAVLAAIHFP